MDGAISIGRNIGNAPMDDNRWKRFIYEIEGAVLLAGGKVYATATGEGEWEGVAEDNAVVTFGNVREIAALKGHLRFLAQDFDQDAIALVLGQSELVGA